LGRLGPSDDGAGRPRADRRDDIFVTNPERLEDGIEKGAANALLVKVKPDRHPDRNARRVALAHNSGYRTMMSHRSGETEDTTIADLAVAVGSGQIKTGAPARSRAVSPSTTSCCVSEETLGTPHGMRATWRSPVSLIEANSRVT